MLGRNKTTGIPFRRLLVGGMLVILLMFVFERQVDDVLELFGYNDDYVSRFPFITNMYFQFLSSKKTSNISTVHFHILDLALWLSIVVWVTWLTAVIIRFKHYDDGFRLGFSRVSERYRGRLSILYIAWVFMLSVPILLSISARPLANNPEVVLVLTYIPKLYFFVVALSYYFGGCLWSLSILVVIWKVFRQDLPSDVLSESAQKEDAGL